MSHLRLITLWPSDEELYEASGQRRRDLIDAFLAALRVPGEVYRVVLEIGAYDRAHPDESPLMDELAGCWIPAAA